MPTYKTVKTVVRQGMKKRRMAAEMRKKSWKTMKMRLMMMNTCSALPKRPSN